MNSLDYSKVVKWIISRELPDCFEEVEKAAELTDAYKETAQRRTIRLLNVRRDYGKKSEGERLRFTPYIVTYMIELARCAKDEHPIYSELIMYCYKTKFNVDINPWARLPKWYGIGHTNGIVVGGIQECGENIFINHGVTIGRFGDKRPKIGNNVLLMPNCMIIGETTIGDGSVIAAGVRLSNQDVPENSLVIAEGNRGEPIIKNKKEDYLSQYLILGETR